MTSLFSTCLFQQPVIFQPTSMLKKQPQNQQQLPNKPQKTKQTKNKTQKANARKHWVHNHPTRTTKERKKLFYSVRKALDAVICS